jgi:hypothetical protein
VAGAGIPAGAGAGAAATYYKAQQST